VVTVIEVALWVLLGMTGMWFVVSLLRDLFGKK
jgi:hypothetical protein